MCFSLVWLRDVFIWLIVIGGCIALIKLLLPIVLAQLGPLGTFGNLIVSAVKIVLWVVVAVLCVYFIFDLVSCLVGSGGFSLPAVPRR